MDFLANPWNLWKFDRMDAKRTVLKLAFEGNLTNCRKEGLRTPELSMPFNASDGFFEG